MAIALQACLLGGNNAAVHLDLCSCPQHSLNTLIMTMETDLINVLYVSDVDQICLVCKCIKQTSKTCSTIFLFLAARNQKNLSTQDSFRLAFTFTWLFLFQSHGKRKGDVLSSSLIHILPTKLLKAK